MTAPLPLVNDSTAFLLSSGVVQTIQYTPGVFLPLFSEIRLTERHYEEAGTQTGQFGTACP
jgi:hypothetical protein